MKLYRYFVGQKLNNSLKLVLQEYDVVKHTPCGYVIVFNGKRKWVSKSAARAFAKKTPEEALYSLVKRKMKQVEILKNQLLKSYDDLFVAMREQREQFKKEEGEKNLTADYIIKMRQEEYLRMLNTINGV